MGFGEGATMTQTSLILRNGRVLSPSSPAGFDEAISFDGERITAIGSNGDIDDLRGPTTRVVDLAGRLAIPAFGDAHVHAISAGLESLRCDLTGIRDRRECLDRIGAYAQNLPADAWVLGS